MWLPVGHMARSHAYIERRRVELERKLAADATLSDERKQRQLQAHGKKESAYLRLKRTKLGLDDFRTVKVIGKGAFGEVRLQWPDSSPCTHIDGSRRSDWSRRQTPARSTP
jgi:hypothetical protein